VIYQKHGISAFPPQYLINGFPKAGLHLIEQMVAQVVPPMPSCHLHTSPWVGTFLHNSWTNDRGSMPQLYYRLARLTAGHYMKGHCGYLPEVATFCDRAGIGVIFVYRDLRDVAVSQAHHTLNPSPLTKHEDKGFFAKMGFDDTLLACIEGIGPYPGIVSRWEQYAGWLDEDVLHIKFEDVREDPLGVAEWIVQYGVKQVTGIFEIEIEFGDELSELTDKMVAAQADRKKSATFRKGKVGGWREVFKPEHIEAFKRTGGADWLVRLGYEENEEWLNENPN